MGYCMRTTEASVTILAGDKQDALNSVLAIMFNEEDMGGGVGGGDPVRWYAFVNNARPSEWETLEQALEEWRWTPETDDDGNIVRLWFRGEKFGDDEYLFKALAPFIQPGSYIRMLGEDGDTWDFLEGLVAA